MSEEIDWNADLRRRIAERDVERARKLSEAKAAAPSGKEPFDEARFRALYARASPYNDTKYTPWETLLRESEYDYYVTHPEMITLQQLVDHLEWEDGWA